MVKFRESKRSGLSFFPVSSAVELSEAQSFFLHWAGIYDWAFSLPANERPADHIIEDDIRFDEWLEYYMAKQTEKSRSGAESGKASRKKAGSHSTVMNNF